MHKRLARRRVVDLDPLGRTVDATEDGAAHVAAAGIEPRHGRLVVVGVADAGLLEKRPALAGAKPA